MTEEHGDSHTIEPVEPLAPRRRDRTAVARNWCLALCLLAVVAWWRFSPRRYALEYRGHKFEYLEPAAGTTNRSARLTVWVGYDGQRPRWWGRPVESRIEDGHQWTFANGVGVQGGGGFPAMATFDAEHDSYKYELEKGLTAYRVENGRATAVAAGLATQCSLDVTFTDPQSRSIKRIPMTLVLKDVTVAFEER